LTISIARQHAASFHVGTQERHEVLFSFDKVWGRMVITVDGVPVKQGVQGQRGSGRIRRRIC
jgi:hypothetical protein